MAERIIDLPTEKMTTDLRFWLRERIVRCRDCKRSFDECSGYLYCGRRPGHCFETRADGFCAWGERKEVDA